MFGQCKTHFCYVTRYITEWKLNVQTYCSLNNCNLFHYHYNFYSLEVFFLIYLHFVFLLFIQLQNSLLGVWYEQRHIKKISFFFQHYFFFVVFYFIYINMCGSKKCQTKRHLNCFKLNIWTSSAVIFFFKPKEEQNRLNMFM